MSESPPPKSPDAVANEREAAAWAGIAAAFELLADHAAFMAELTAPKPE